MFQDVRFGLRILAKSPAATLVAILTLALGIGVNTAIFSVLNAALLKFLPVRNPNELVTLTDPNASMVLGGLLTGDRSLLTYTEFVALRDRATSLSGLCASQMALQRWPVRISGGGSEQVRGRLVSENYFTVFGVEPARGRLFTQHDATAVGKDPYAVISYDYWQRRFRGDPSVIGTPIHLHQATLIVIGVAAQDFHGETVGQNPDLWLPMLMQPLVMPGFDGFSEYFQSHDKLMWLHSFGRRKPGVPLARVQAEMNVLFRAILAAGYPTTMQTQDRRRALDQRIVVRPLRAGMFHGRAEFSEQWRILSALAGMILLMSCANVANLLLARATARAREVAIRISLGAAKQRLFRQFLTESLLLASFGGGAGILAAALVLPLLLRIFSGHSFELAAKIDPTVFGFTAALTLLTGILFGLVPALRSTRMVRATRSRLSKVLVIAQVTLSFLLVMGAGLFLETLWNLQSVPLGYSPENLLLVHVDDAPGVSPGRALVDRIRRIPGVRDVTYSDRALFGFDGAFPIAVEGFTPRNQDEGGSTGGFIGPGYFSTLGIPLLLGREIGPRDTVKSPPVCVINEAFAKHFFAGRNPLGKHVTTGGHSMQVIGVAANARTHSLRGKIDEKFYAAADQNTGASWFEIRTAPDLNPKRLVQTLRREIPSIDSAQSLDELIRLQNAQPRFVAELSAAFGILGLVLASTGIYGLLSYTVANRTKEFGIRMALGAEKRRVTAMVLGETGALLAIGAIAGAFTAAVITRLISAQLYGAAITGPRWSLARYEHVESATQLYGLRALDPPTIAAAIGILCIAALLAACVPAARAAQVDPATTLRHD
jgi:predicted permease